MPPEALFTILRRTVPALGLCAAFLLFATPAVAGPLCVTLQDTLDTNFDEDGNESVGGEDDAVDLNGDDAVCRDFDPGFGVSAYYLFDTDADGTFSEGEHLLRVGFDEVINSFGLAFELVYHPAGTDFGIDGYTCLAYADGDLCVEYQSMNEVSSDDYFGLVYWLIAWTPEMGTIDGEIIHAPGTTDDYSILTENRYFDPNGGPRDYDCDSPYFAPCTIIEIGLKAPGDPARGATSNNFSSVVNMESVPEPGTMALFGIALGGYVLNRRRRE